MIKFQATHWQVQKTLRSALKDAIFRSFTLQEQTLWIKVIYFYHKEALKSYLSLSVF